MQAGRKTDSMQESLRRCRSGPFFDFKFTIDLKSNSRILHFGIRTSMEGGSRVGVKPSRPKDSIMAFKHTENFNIA